MPALVMLSVSAVALAAVTAPMASIFSFLVSCEGVDGVPFAAPDSSLGQFCESPGKIWWTVLAVAPGATSLLGAATTLVRRRFKPLVMATVAAAVIVLIGVAVPAVLSGRCSESQLAAGARCDHA